MSTYFSEQTQFILEDIGQVDDCFEYELGDQVSVDDEIQLPGFNEDICDDDFMVFYIDEVRGSQVLASFSHWASEA